jgi:hypothetical protein
VNKAFSKYKKEKWTNTRLSRKHKCRQFLIRVQTASTLASGAALINQIQNTFGANKADKKIAILKAVSNTLLSVKHIRG